MRYMQAMCATLISITGRFNGLLRTLLVLPVIVLFFPHVSGAVHPPGCPIIFFQSPDTPPSIPSRLIPTIGFLQANFPDLGLDWSQSHVISYRERIVDLPRERKREHALIFESSWGTIAIAENDDFAREALKHTLVDSRPRVVLKLQVVLSNGETWGRPGAADVVGTPAQLDQALIQEALHGFLQEVEMISRLKQLKLSHLKFHFALPWYEIAVQEKAFYSYPRKEALEFISDLSKQYKFPIVVCIVLPNGYAYGVVFKNGRNQTANLIE